MPDLSKPLPPFDPAEKLPNSTLGPIAGDVEMLPTWHADEIPKDAKLARIHPDEQPGGTNAGVGHDGAHPRHLERTAGVFSSDRLLGAGE